VEPDDKNIGAKEDAEQEDSSAVNCFPTKEEQRAAQKNNLL
jgi:hypothetical protein